MIEFSCMSCELKYRLDTQYPGKQVACVKCGAIFTCPVISYQLLESAPIGYTNESTISEWKTSRQQKKIEETDKFSTRIFVRENDQLTKDSYLEVVTMWVYNNKSNTFIVQRLQKLFKSVPPEQEIHELINFLRKKKRKFTRILGLVMILGGVSTIAVSGLVIFYTEGACLAKGLVALSLASILIIFRGIANIITG